MPVIVNPEACQDERGALLAYLDAQRGGIRRAVYGLTEEQARSTPSASALSLSALLKHALVGERGWLATVQGRVGDPKEQMAVWEDGFRPAAAETVEVLLDRYEAAARETDAAIRALPSLDGTYETPRYPWDEGGTRTWRWLILHMIEEIARHTGHADIIRETIDGKGAFDLVFETGAMPEPDWSVLER